MSDYDGGYDDLSVGGQSDLDDGLDWQETTAVEDDLAEQWIAAQTRRGGVNNPTQDLGAAFEILDSMAATHAVDTYSAGVISPNEFIGAATNTDIINQKLRSTGLPITPDLQVGQLSPNQMASDVIHYDLSNLSNKDRTLEALGIQGIQGASIGSIGVSTIASNTSPMQFDSSSVSAGDIHFIEAATLNKQQEHMIGAIVGAAMSGDTTKTDMLSRMEGHAADLKREDYSVGGRSIGGIDARGVFQEGIIPDLARRYLGDNAAPDLVQRLTKELPELLTTSSKGLQASFGAGSFTSHMDSLLIPSALPSRYEGLTVPTLNRLGQPFNPDFLYNEDFLSASPQKQQDILAGADVNSAYTTEYRGLSEDQRFWKNRENQASPIASLTGQPLIEGARARGNLSQQEQGVLRQQELITNEYKGFLSLSGLAENPFKTSSFKANSRGRNLTGKLSSDNSEGTATNFIRPTIGADYHNPMDELARIGLAEEAGLEGFGGQEGDMSALGNYAKQVREVIGENTPFSSEQIADILDNRLEGDIEDITPTPEAKKSLSGTSAILKAKALRDLKGISDPEYPARNMVGGGEMPTAENWEDRAKLMTSTVRSDTDKIWRRHVSDNPYQIPMQSSNKIPDLTKEHPIKTSINKPSFVGTTTATPSITPTASLSNVTVEDRERMEKELHSYFKSEGVTVSNAEQNTPEWKSERFGGVNASEVGDAMFAGAYAKTLTEKALSFTNKAEKSRLEALNPDLAATARNTTFSEGHEAEPKVLKAFEENNPDWATFTMGRLTREDMPNVGASVDAIAVHRKTGERQILELKHDTQGNKRWGLAKKHAAQVETQQAVTGIDNAQVVSSFDANKYARGASESIDYTTEAVHGNAAKSREELSFLGSLGAATAEYHKGNITKEDLRDAQLEAYKIRYPNESDKGLTKEELAVKDQEAKEDRERDKEDLKLHRESVKKSNDLRDNTLTFLASGTGGVGGLASGGMGALMRGGIPGMVAGAAIGVGMAGHDALVETANLSVDAAIVGAPSAQGYEGSKSALRSLGFTNGADKSFADKVYSQQALASAGRFEGMQQRLGAYLGLLDMEDLRYLSPEEQVDKVRTRAKEWGLTDQEVAGRAIAAGDQHIAAAFATREQTDVVLDEARDIAKAGLDAKSSTDIAAGKALIIAEDINLKSRLKQEVLDNSGGIIGDIDRISNSSISESLLRGFTYPGRTFLEALGYNNATSVAADASTGTSGTRTPIVNLTNNIKVNKDKVEVETKQDSDGAEQPTIIETF